MRLWAAAPAAGHIPVCQAQLREPLSDQTSVLRFIEDIWLGGARVSEISFDRKAGSLLDMFDLARRVTRRRRGATRPRSCRAGRG